MASIRHHRRHLMLSLGAAALFLTACPAPASPTPASAPASPTVNPVTMTKEVVQAPFGAGIKISSPTVGVTVPAGDVRVTVDVTHVNLVPDTQATRVEDLHIHVLLDVDPSPYLAPGNTNDIPTGRPDIVHTAERDVVFSNARPGQYRVTVILTGANHISVNPPVSDAVTLTVE
jgi:hypothetical protein